MVIHVVSEIRCKVYNGNEGHIFKNQILSWWYSYTQNSNIIKKMVVIISEIRNDDDDRSKIDNGDKYIIKTKTPQKIIESIILAPLTLRYVHATKGEKCLPNHAKMA